MKKKSLVKKALLPAIVAVMCSLLALTSVSYAWFTMGNKASVEDITVNVQAVEGLQISATGEDQTWKSILPLADLQAQETNQFVDDSSSILPMSSAAEVIAGKLQLFEGTVEDDVLTATKAVELDDDATQVNFIAFDLFIKLDTQTDLYLDKDSVVTAAANNTHTAVRVAFVLLGTEDTTAELEGVEANVGSVNSPENAQVWEPNSTTRYDGETQTKQAYNGVAAEGANPTTKAVNTFDFADADYRLYQDLAAGVTKIRVYIWLEGQDVDCINDISGSAFTVTLKFNVPQADAEE